MNPFWNRTAGILLSAFLLFSCSSKSSQTAKPVAAAARPEEVTDAQKILAGYDAALGADPDNVELRVARCSFLGEMAEIARDRREQFRARALADCEHAVNHTRNERVIAHVTDVARVIEGRQVFGERKVACPEDARKSAQHGYYLLRANQLKESLPHFERAVARCPENALFSIRYGHAFLLLRDFDRAEKYLSQGLKRDPWDRFGHVLLSNLYRETNKLEPAYNHALLAVLNDPTYEFGWEQLKELATVRGGDWRRPINRRGVVRSDSKGNPHVVLPVGSDLNSPETQFWLSLGLIEVSEIKTSAKHAGGAPDKRTPLERDRQRVRENLELHRQIVAKDPAKRSQIADILEEAMKKGYLDEAIFLCLMDARLAPEFIVYREKRRERLLDYISSILAPARPSARRSR